MGGFDDWDRQHSRFGGTVASVGGAPIRAASLSSTDWAHRALSLSDLYSQGSISTSNELIYAPLLVPRTMTVDRVFMHNGSTGTGNWCVGIYDADANMRPNSLLEETASTAYTTTNVWVSADLGASITLEPDQLYFFAHAGSNSNQEWLNLYSSVTKCLAWVFSEASITVGSLPSTATPVGGDDDITTVDRVMAGYVVNSSD